MDSTKSFIRCLLMDVEDYLQYVEDFGRPNYKYFNFVLNKLGLMHVFLYKSNIFKNKTSLLVKFMDLTLIALKKKFLEEKSCLKRAGLIFLVSKIYFTDDIAINLKLRIQQEEWEVFRSFIREIKNDNEYQSICLIFMQLFTENFFRFTLKTPILALDYNSHSAVTTSTYDECLTGSTSFWSSIEKIMKHLELVNLKEMKQLSEIRKKEIKPFDKLLPEKDPVDDIFKEFATLKENIEKSKKNTKRTSRKEVIAVCRDYIKTSRNNKRVNDLFESDGDFDLDFNSLTTKKKRKGRNKLNKKETIINQTAQEEILTSTNSDSEINVNDMG